jgi:cytochrome b involved in lipid metabolism
MEKPEQKKRIMPKEVNKKETKTQGCAPLKISGYVYAVGFVFAVFGALASSFCTALCS